MIHVTRIAASRTDTQATLSARISCPGSKLDGSELWLRYPPEYGACLSSSGDPWLALLLWPAMRLGRTLRTEAALSSMLVESVPALMAIMHCWDTRFTPIEVQPQATSCAGTAGAAVAGFFSGGIDSFYTALKNTAPQIPALARLTHLVSVHGLDVRLRDEALWARVRHPLRESAASLGCTWVECATNVREIVPEELVTWPLYYGAVLAAIGLGVQGLWHRVLIPAAQTFAELRPGGSHPLLDPLWSTESVHFVNDGAEATRLEKINSQVARSSVALQHLRVCWENRNGKYNCGVCEKCLRTMVSLKIAGVLDQCRSFDRPLSYKAVTAIKFVSPVHRVLMEQNYRAALATGSDPLLIRALERCVNPSLAWQVRCALLERVRQLARRIDQLLLGGRLRRWRRSARASQAPAPTLVQP